MNKRPAWFDACIIGGVFTLILVPASASMGFFMLLVNLVGLGLFVAPMVAAFKDGDLD